MDKKKNISEFFGLLGDSEQSAEELQEIVRSIRKSVSESFKKRHKVFNQLGEEGKVK